MPCNGIATVTAQVAIDLSPLVESEELALAAAQALASALAETAAPLTLSRRSSFVILRLGEIGVTVHRDGRLECTDLRPGAGPASAARIRAAAEQIVLALAGCLLQAQLADLIGQLCPLEALQRTAGGALVLTVQL